MFAGRREVRGQQAPSRALVGVGTAPGFMPNRNSALIGKGAQRLTTRRVSRLANTASPVKSDATPAFALAEVCATDVAGLAIPVVLGRANGTFGVAPSLPIRSTLEAFRERAISSVADLETLGERERAFLGSNPSVYPYRSSIAIVLAQRGEQDRARKLALEELELARAWGAPRSIGIAQRALGLVDGDGLESLFEAVATLESSGARLEQARALVDLGATLRRAGQRADARRHLAAGMDLAHACGATVLADRAREELVVAGARPGAWRKPGSTRSRQASAGLPRWRQSG